VVNLQGDAPLTPAWFVEDLVAGLRADPGADVATPVCAAMAPCAPS
jgi:3-deoxy-manno-octulosonate cytidylyltransferase (CMP-KDO synthetase)